MSQATLPLNYSSSVFVRVDEGNLALWRAMITGPSDTPCASLLSHFALSSTAFQMAYRLLTSLYSAVSSVRLDYAESSNFCTADSHGAFIFDAYFPPQYPAGPPQVLLRTTGGNGSCWLTSTDALKHLGMCVQSVHHNLQCGNPKASRACMEDVQRISS